MQILKRWRRGLALPGGESRSFNSCSSQSTDSIGFIRVCYCKLLKCDLSLRELGFVEGIFYMTQYVPICPLCSNLKYKFDLFA